MLRGMNSLACGCQDKKPAMQLGVTPEQNAGAVKAFFLVAAVLIGANLVMRKFIKER